MINFLFKKSSVYLGGLLLSKVLGAATFILLARGLAPALFGEFVLYITLLQLITFFGDFGLVQWYQKKVQKPEERITYFASIISFRMVTLLLSILAGSVFLLISQTFTVPIILIFIISLLFESGISISDAYYFEKKKSLHVAMKTIIRMFVFLVGILLIQTTSLQTIVLLFLLATCITFVWYIPWNMISKINTFHIQKNWKTLTDSSPYALLMFTSFTYSKGDSLLISFLINNAALGIYSTAYRFLESISLIPTALAHNLFPIAAKQEGIKQSVLIRLTMLFAVFGVIIGAVLFFIAEPLIVILIGQEYIEAVPVLRIFSIAVVLFFINGPLSTVIQSSHIIKKFLPVGISNTILNVILNVILLPMYGINAAAWIMVFTEVTGLLINMYFIKAIYANNS